MLFGKIWFSLIISCAFGFIVAWLIRAYIARSVINHLEGVYKKSIDATNKKNASLLEDIKNLKKFYTEQLELFKFQKGLSPEGIKITDENEPEIMDKEPQKKDDLSQILGISKQIQESLNNLGIYTFKQIANLSPHNVNWVANRIGLKPEKIYQERWVQQAYDMRNYKLH